jgi:hypothetical protein
MSDEGVKYRQFPVATYIDSIDGTFDVEIGYRPVGGANLVYIEVTDGDTALMVDLTPDSAQALWRDLQEAIASARREVPQ